MSESGENSSGLKTKLYNHLLDSEIPLSIRDRVLAGVQESTANTRSVIENVTNQLESLYDKTTSLMTEHALMYSVIEDIESSALKFLENANQNNINELVHFIKSNIPPEYDPLIEEIVESKNDSKKYDLLALYLDGLLSTGAWTSIDLIKLKSCNTFWTDKIPGRNSFSIVDSVGYSPMGLALKGISALSAATEYDELFEEGRTFRRASHKNPNEFTTESTSEFLYKMKAKLNPEQLELLKSCSIVPARQGTKGDEFYVKIEYVKKDTNGRKVLMPIEALGKINGILNEACSVIVGEFDENERAVTQKDAEELLADYNPIAQDTPQLVTMELRAGGLLNSKNSERAGLVGAIIRYAALDTNFLNLKSLQESFKLFISQADASMEKAKKTESIRLLFNLFNKKKVQSESEQSKLNQKKIDAAMTILLLVKQGRFFGDVDIFKAIINSDEFKNKENFTWQDALILYQRLEQRKTEIPDTTDARSGAKTRI